MYPSVNKELLQNKYKKLSIRFVSGLWHFRLFFDIFDFAWVAGTLSLWK